MSNSYIPGNAEGEGTDSRLLTLEVSRIDSYDRNPRHSRNPEYDRIKASIRADGMEQPLVITQRPGDNDFIIRSGGNTRLQIIKELFQETGDRRFSSVQCVFRAWTRETDVLLAHLKENDLRGNLSFLDKSRAVLETKQLIEQESVGDALSQRQLVEALRERGYHLSQGLLSYMEYAVQRFLPVLPEALQTMSRGHVECIRRLDSVTTALWHDMEADTQQDYNETFDTLCRRYDGPDWDTDNLRRALEAELEMLSDLNIHQVRMELDERLSGRGGVIPVRRDGRVRGDQEDSGSTAGRTPDDPQDAHDQDHSDRSTGQAVAKDKKVHQRPGTGTQTETTGEVPPPIAGTRATEHSEGTVFTPEPDAKPKPEAGETLISIGI